MPFTPPKLDDRSFQQLVDELKKRIPLYCPEWTDHNVSDPGITLLELFAYLTEQMLYRMNQVPRLHYQKFAQFLGIPIPTPQPARAVVTFWLTKALLTEKDPDNVGLPIAAGTEVATTQTETIAPIIFTTMESVKIWTPRLCAVIRQPRGSTPEWIADREFAKSEWQVDLFTEIPQVGDAFYFVFDNDLSHHVLCLQLDFEKTGTNINEAYPPIAWEAYTDQHRWERLDDADIRNTTRGLNAPGEIELHLPKLAKYNWRVVNPAKPEISQPRYTLRLQITRKEYDRSPHLRRIHKVATMGRNVETEHTQLVENEYLGESDGSPGQRFPLRYAPIILPLRTGETFAIGSLPVVNKSEQPETAKAELPKSEQLERWRYVENFSYPSSADNGKPPETTMAPSCFTIDVTTNEVRLGPAIQLPTGEIKLYGRVPERGRPLYFTRYRYGAALVNVPSKTINVLKSSIPYIKGVENRRPATGGQGAPSLEAMEVAVQQYLRYHRPRFGQAITAEDYATLILARFSEHVAKVECYTDPEVADAIFVVVIAPLSGDTLSAASITAADLAVKASTMEEIDKYLHEYRLLTTQLQVRPRVEHPQFVQIHVQLSLAGKENNDIQAEVRKVITAYLHPLHGGVAGRGWLLGSRLNATALKLWLENCLPAIQIRRLQLQKESLQPVAQNGSATQPTNQQGQRQWVEEINDLARNQLLIPGRYEIIFE